MCQICHDLGCLLSLQQVWESMATYRLTVRPTTAVIHHFDLKLYNKPTLPNCPSNNRARSLPHNHNLCTERAFTCLCVSLASAPCWFPLRYPSYSSFTLLPHLIGSICSDWVWSEPVNTVYLLVLWAITLPGNAGCRGVTSDRRLWLFAFLRNEPVLCFKALLHF